MGVRDQLKMTIAAYEELFENSVRFGNLKQHEAEDGMDMIKSRLKYLEDKEERLNKQVSLDWYYSG